jgi:hypothetical protein
MVKSKRFVYNLIYPALLGSMIYDMLPYKQETEYFIKLSIVILYLIDYIHLYLFMNDKFKRTKKSSWYISLDLIISLLLFVGFKSAYIHPLLTIWTITFVPICFLIYNILLDFKINFYLIYSSLSILVAIGLTSLSNCDSIFSANCKNSMFLGFILSITFTYFIFVTYITIKKQEN